MNTPRTALRHAHALGLARIDAQMLLLHALGRDVHARAWLIAHDADPLPADARALFDALCLRRLAGEPLAYLTGRKDFYGLTLHVDARVLDPRADTETLVDWALELLQARRAPRIADLGTGSGAIALALQHQRADAQILATDASADALALARANARRLGLGVRFAQHDWLAGVDERFDLIVSNPPYIALGDAHLGALTHEPLAALTSGACGLADLRTIIAQAPAHLAPGAWLLLEHGWEQARAVQELLCAAGFSQVQGRRDLAGHVRASGGQWSAPSSPNAASGLKNPG